MQTFLGATATECALEFPPFSLLIRVLFLFQKSTAKTVRLRGSQLGGHWRSPWVALGKRHLELKTDQKGKREAKRRRLNIQTE